MNTKKNTLLPNLNIPGLLFDKDKSAYLFAPQQLPASEHFFRSNVFSAEISGGEIHLLFGQKSIFDKNKNNLKAAIEISMPLKMALIFLHDVIHVHPSLSGDNTFYSILSKSIPMSAEIKRVSSYEESLELPSDPNLYRAFSSNYCTVAMSHGQTMIEFFEANPALIANLSHGKPTRERDGLKPVVAIITPPEMMKDFFDKTKILLSPYINKLGDKYELEPQP